MSYTYPESMSTIITESMVAVVIDGKQYLASKGQPQYGQVLQILRNWNEGLYHEDLSTYEAVAMFTLDLTDAFTPARIMENYLNNVKDERVTYSNGNVYFNGEILGGPIATRIKSLAQQSLPIDPLLRFCENLQGNPSKNSADQLLGFLEKHHMAITNEGKFKAYKVVNSNFTDCHTGRIDNSVGQTVRMQRNRVQDDPTITCSHGLHVCAHEYARGFFFGSGRILVEVEVDPSNVVSIPTDYNNAKMRVCEYTVIRELERGIEEDIYGNRHYADYDNPVMFGDDDPLGDNYDDDWLSSYDENIEEDEAYDDWDTSFDSDSKYW